MTDGYSNDFTRRTKAEKRQSSHALDGTCKPNDTHKLDGTRELNAIRDELLQLQATAQVLLEMLAETAQPHQQPGVQAFDDFSQGYRARSIALLDRLDRYIDTRGG